MPGQAKRLAKTDIFQAHAGGDGNGKGIHCQRHGDGGNVNELHLKSVCLSVL